MNGKDRAIQAGIDNLRSDLEDSQNMLYLALLEYAAGLYGDGDGNFVSDDANIFHANNVISVFDEWYDEFLPTISSVVATVEQLKSLSAEYFEEIGYESDESELGFVGLALGYGDGGIVRGGYLDSIARMEEVRNDVRYFFFAGVISQRRIREFLDDMRQYIVGEEKLGIVEKYMRRVNLEDVFKQSLTMSDKYFADKHELDKFRYSGGLIETSRDFCVERDGLEFWRYQGEEWNDLFWRGKIEGMDFFVQVGGYNCRHYLEWFSSKE